MTLLTSPTDISLTATPSTPQPVILAFPGVDSQWPTALQQARDSTPHLAQWRRDVITNYANWARSPEARATGWITVDPNEWLSADRQADPLDALAPRALPGTLLASLTAFQGLLDSGVGAVADLTVGADSTTCTGHSAGLLAAWVAGQSAPIGRVTPEVAADALKLATMMGIAAQRSTHALSTTDMTGLQNGASDKAVMVSVSGPRLAQLQPLIAQVPGVQLAVVNTATSHVLAGSLEQLGVLQRRLEDAARKEAATFKEGQHRGRPFSFEWEPLANSAPFHHDSLQDAAEQVCRWLADANLALTGSDRLTVIDPATNAEVHPQDGLQAVVWSVLARPQNWSATVSELAQPGATLVGVGRAPAIWALTTSAMAGRGVPVVRTSEVAERDRFLRAEADPAGRPACYSDYTPQVTTAASGELQLQTRHTRLSGRSPIVLAGMTPTTVDVPIVAAAANAGHVAELAGGGQVSQHIFDLRMAELRESLTDGHEVVFNALHLDPYLWGLHLGGEKLVQKARKAGAPICGVTISGGIPDLDDAARLLAELRSLGVWLNALKPGTTQQIDDALAIAATTEDPLWLHVEGGAAGGHHSWESLDDLLLSRYEAMRAQDNVVLCVGGGIDSPQTAAAYLTGDWALQYGPVRMPVDAILVGTVAMATAESTASDDVKRLLVDTPGASDNVARGQVRGAITSGKSGLNADIHFVANTAAATAQLLDQVAGDGAAVADRRDEIIAALQNTAKPYFGDLDSLSYADVLSRFVELTAVGRGGRYEFGRWLDRSHATLFHKLLQRWEARLTSQDRGLFESHFPRLSAVANPEAAIQTFAETFPAADTARMHPADSAYFLHLIRQPGKPVPFVPVIDADVRRSYQSDSLWQAHTDLYPADAVLVIPGPTAASGITTVDEPIATLLTRFELAAATIAANQGEAQLELDAATGRFAGSQPLIRKVLGLQNWTWLGASRPNPLQQIAPLTAWSIQAEQAEFSHHGERISLRRSGATGELQIEFSWPALGLSGDGLLRLPIFTDVQEGVLTAGVDASRMNAVGDLLINRMSPSKPPGIADGPAHAAMVGSGVQLPDRVMSAAWPDIFASLAQAGLAPHLLDLLHVNHEISNPLPDTHGPITATKSWPPAIIAVTGGVTATVVTEVSFDDQPTTITDTFFISRPDRQSEQSQTALDNAAVDTWTPTPVRTLGELDTTAPVDLYPFAQITGDYNPIHRSDLLARFCGLPDRIVHGMWTSALAQRAAIEHACGGDSQRLRAWDISFTAPVTPGAELNAVTTRSAVRNGSQQVTVTVSALSPTNTETDPDEETVAVATATIAPAKTAYIFPGQGIQQPEMGMDAMKRSTAARRVWRAADAHTREVLGFSILQIVQDNPTTLGVRGQIYRHPDGVLHLTQFTQVAMATLAAAQVAELTEAEALVPGAICAGHSVGEYNALSACTNVLPLEAVLEIVFARGQAMHQLVPRADDGSSNYRLGVIRPHLAGLDHSQAEALVIQTAADTGELCEIVNHNLKGKQYAVAGTVAALSALSTALGEGVAGKAPFLLVPGIDVPFHSRALRNGVPEFRKHLQAKLPDKIDPAELVGRYIPNLYPAPFQLDRAYVSAVFEVCQSEQLADVLKKWDQAAADPARLARTLLVELLAWQFASPVQWIQTTEVLCDLSGLAVQEVVEIGLGTAPTLTNLFKGALALPEHTGTRPRVRNLEIDSDQILQQDQDSAPITEPEPVVAKDSPEARRVEAEVTQPASSTPAQTQSAPDVKLDAGDAALRVVALRAGLRLDQIAQDSIEQLVDGASSRRNQVLLDLGKEFGIAAIDGAQDWAMPELADKLRAQAAQYRFPGPVLAPALDSGLNTVLGPIGANKADVARRLSNHWGLPAGWLNWVLLELALAGRGGQSKRGGALAHLPDCTTTDELIDTAANSVAQQLGLPLPEPVATDSVEDSAALAAAAAHFEDVLADNATGLLRDLDRLPAPQVRVDHSTELARLALLEQEHGSDRSALIAPIFTPARHVHFASGQYWARADLDHLAHVAMATEVAGEQLETVDRIRRLSGRLAKYVAADQIAARRAEWYHTSLAHTYPLTAQLFGDLFEDQADNLPPGFLTGTSRHLSEDAQQLPDLARQAACGITPRRSEVALVTGASPGSIGAAAVKLLLSSGATVIVTTSNDTSDRLAYYRDLERDHAAPGAQLHMIPANLASFTDIDALVDWLVSPTQTTNGLTTTLTKEALWPTLVLPFAAAPATGSLPEAGVDSEVSLRLLLTGLERLIGTLAERSIAASQPVFTCVLPLSPNHGTFGGDGSYGAAKAGLESVGNRWSSEYERWGKATRLLLATIGWVRGTGLMGGNDNLAHTIEEDHGIRTYTPEEMAALILAATGPEWIGRADHAPTRLDLGGGLAQLGDLSGILQSAAEPAQDLPTGQSVADTTVPAVISNGAAPGSDPHDGAASDAEGTDQGILALANLPAELLATTVEPVLSAPEATISARDMVVIVGIAEQGPWGSSATRQAAEIGEFSTASLVELAWRSGTVEWDQAKATWRDTPSGTEIAESDFSQRYEQELMRRCGLRSMEETAGVHPEGTLAFAEVFVDKALSLSVTSEQQARALAADIDGAQVLQESSGGWQLQLPAGARIRVPHRRTLQRGVAGQFPQGSDPARHGLDPGVVAGMDPLAAWNLVATAEAFAHAGLSPAELHDAVHPTMIGNTQGSGMGGMASIKSLYVDPMVGTEHANDLLQEALGNVVSAHTNTELVGGYGPMVHPVAACATAAVSLEDAVDKIRLGKAKFVVAGGWDDLSDEGINGFADMSATADNTALADAGIAPRFQSRPGDKRRGGFVEAQGGGSFLVCTGEVALQMGLPVRAVVAYAGSFGDGINASIPAPGLGAIGAATGGNDSPLMTGLAKLGLSADDIEVVSKHDTSTAANDPNEAQIHTTIQAALGRTPGAPLRVISQKSLTGHAKGGAAAWQLAGLCDVFASNVIPGNQSLTCVDPEVVPGDWLTVDYRPLDRATPVQAALLTSLGFGHVSAVVAVAHPDVFVAAISQDQQVSYLERSRERRAIGCIAALAARHGGTSVLQRQTYRGFPTKDVETAREEEATVLLDPAGRIDLRERSHA